MEVRDAAHRAVIRALSLMTLSWIAAVLPSGGVRSGRQGDDAETLINPTTPPGSRLLGCTAAHSVVCSISSVLQTASLTSAPATKLAA